jgi:hypothetical protein
MALIILRAVDLPAASLDDHFEQPYGEKVVRLVQEKNEQ